jgi:hypothetical protein
MTNSGGDYSVYALNGSLMKSDRVENAADAKFSISSWESGIYFFHYTYTSGKSGVLRFVKP